MSGHSETSFLQFLRHCRMPHKHVRPIYRVPTRQDAYGNRIVLISDIYEALDHPGSIALFKDENYTERVHVYVDFDLWPRHIDFHPGQMLYYRRVFDHCHPYNNIQHNPPAGLNTPRPQMFGLNQGPGPNQGSRPSAPAQPHAALGGAGSNQAAGNLNPNSAQAHDTQAGGRPTFVTPNQGARTISPVPGLPTFAAPPGSGLIHPTQRAQAGGPGASEPLNPRWGPTTLDWLSISLMELQDFATTRIDEIGNILCNIQADLLALLQQQQQLLQQQQHQNDGYNPFSAPGPVQASGFFASQPTYAHHLSAPSPRSQASALNDLNEVVDPFDSASVAGIPREHRKGRARSSGPRLEGTEAAIFARVSSRVAGGGYSASLPGDLVDDGISFIDESPPIAPTGGQTGNTSTTVLTPAFVTPAAPAPTAASVAPAPATFTAVPASPERKFNPGYYHRLRELNFSENLTQLYWNQSNEFVYPETAPPRMERPVFVPSYFPTWRAHSANAVLQPVRYFIQGKDVVVKHSRGVRDNAVYRWVQKLDGSYEEAVDSPFGGQTPPYVQGGQTPPPPAEDGQTPPPHAEGGQSFPQVESGHTPPHVEGGHTTPPAEGGAEGVVEQEQGVDSPMAEPVGTHPDQSADEGVADQPVRGPMEQPADNVDDDQAVEGQLDQDLQDLFEGTLSSTGSSSIRSGSENHHGEQGETKVKAEDLSGYESPSFSKSSEKSPKRKRSSEDEGEEEGNTSDHSSKKSTADKARSRSPGSPGAGASGSSPKGQRR
ncbi:hypothetical protein BGX29_005093 [Mortierella sp. GBA35]|nr:hypothetical protein BGX29_005093 [Mortierella sp. GBA35]